MTATMISLVSILIGIVGANSTGLVLQKYSLGITGNTIAGVFGSVLLIKSFGRLGFDPKSIIQLETINYSLLTINIIVSFCGGVMAVFLIRKLKSVLDNSQ